MRNMSDNQLFSPELRGQLQEVLSNLNREQLLWLGGYISAAIDFAPVATAVPAAQAQPKAMSQATDAVHVPGSKSLTVLYGSHSGNSQRVAIAANQEAERLGIRSKLLSMEDYNVRFLKDEEQLLIVVSTHGEGEPPVVAQELYGLLSGRKAPNLQDKPFAVIALGDSSYKKFCQTGIDFHEFLKRQGATPLADVATLDVDFSNELPKLIPSVVKLFAGTSVASGTSTRTAGNTAPSVQVADVLVEVPVTEKVPLNGRGSEKETWHIELSTDKTGLVYQPGDALEVYASNSPQLVKRIADQLGLPLDELVEVDAHQVSLREALTHYYELTVVTAPVLKKYAALLPNGDLKDVLCNSDAQENFLRGTDVLDLVAKYPVKLTADQLIGILRKLPPRLYSISSSPAEVGKEIHITVGAVRYEKDERLREGVASTYLADRLEDDENLKVKIRPNNQFRLPVNGDVPVIMVGAGTGIAPFRAFIQHRGAEAAMGKNWLVFGDQHFTTDFLYQAEWLRYRKAGLLTKLDVAFSRDQEEKIYVQHRLKENGKELYEWILAGAHFYVCGDMKRMARDVKNAFLDVLQIEGKMSREDAETYLARLKKDGRYQEDVY
ncbi:MAG: assimilatory sulfite reductase (NADPH) flavoprotein subunit [Breznakibacter sp.]